LGLQKEDVFFLDYDINRQRRGLLTGFFGGSSFLFHRRGCLDSQYMSVAKKAVFDG
jgi:hypothetical protein